MRKWWIIGAIVIVLGAGFAYALANFNAYLNDNKDWLAAQAEAALGRRVDFDEIGVSIFGGLGARITNLRVADDPAFSSEDFVRTGRLQVLVKILPALFGRYEVRRLVLESPAVTVIRTGRGFNFETIGRGSRPATQGGEGGQREQQPQPEHAAPETAPAGKAEALPLLISAMRINDGELRFIDRTAASGGTDGKEIAVRQLDFSASDVSFSAPVRVAVAAALLGSAKQNFTFDGTVGPVGEVVDVQRIPVRATLELDPLDLDALRDAVPAAAEQIPPGLGLSGPLRLKARLAGSVAELSIADLDLRVAVFGASKPNLTVTGGAGPLRLEAPAPGTKVDMRIELGPVVLDEVKRFEALGEALPDTLSAPGPVRLRAAATGTLDDLHVSASFEGDDAAIGIGSAFVKPKGVPLRLDLQAERSNATVELRQLKLRLAELALSGGGKIVTSDPLSVNLQLDVARTPLASLSRLLPTLAAHEVSGAIEAQIGAAGRLGGDGFPQVTGRVGLSDVRVRVADSPLEIEGLSAAIELEGDAAVLPPTKFSLGGSPVELQATLEPLRAPVLRFTLHSPRLRAASIGAASASGDGDEVFNGVGVDGTLRTGAARPSFQGSVRSSGGRLRGVDYQEFRGNVRLENDVVTLDGVSVRAFDGTATASGRYDMRSAQSPAFDVRTAIQAARLRELLGGAFPGAATRIEGLLDANLSLAGTGTAWESIRQTLRGEGRAEVKDGTLKNVNIAEAVLGGITGIPGLASLIAPEVRGEFSDLFAAKDTSFETLSGSLRVADGRVTTDDVMLAARDYEIRGRGAFTFENHVDFTATLIASPRLTREVVAETPVAKHLAGSDGRLAVPFRMAGVLPDVRPKPDMGFVTGALRGALVEEGLGKLLGGRKGDTQTGDAQEDKEQPAPEPPASSPEDLLRKGLEGLLGR